MSYKKLSVTAAILAASFSSSAYSKVVINELSIDDQGSDTAQFIELHNTAETSVNLDGWQIQVGAAVGVEGIANFTSSHVIPPKGFFIVGTDVAGSGRIGVTPDIYLTGTSVILRNYKGFTTLKNPSNEIEDSVVWARGEVGRTIPAGHGEVPSEGTENTGGGIWSYLLTSKLNNAAGAAAGYALGLEAQPNTTLTFQRDPNTLYIDTDDNDLDFHLAIATPKAPNYSRGTVTPTEVAAGLTFDFEEAAGTPIKKLAGIFADFHSQDPQSASLPPNSYTPTNPNVIPPAPLPGGGNVGITYVNTINPSSIGHGNAAILNLTEPVLNVEAETLVYIGEPKTGSQWEVGTYLLLRGRPDPLHFYGEDVANPTGVNGDVGARIRFENNVNGSGKVFLYVEEQKHGTPVQFGSPVEITQGGWYRLLLSVKDDKLVAYIGGQFGNYTSADGTLANGIRFPAAQGQAHTFSITKPGGIGFNYHSKIPAGAESYETLRPITYDHLTFRTPSVIPTANVADWYVY